MSVAARLEALDPAVQAKGRALFEAAHQRVCQAVDRMFLVLMLIQYVCGVVAAYWLTPLTWNGSNASPHLHVWMAAVLGGLATAFPVALALLRPGTELTRHVVTIGQLTMSAILIHVTGGRIETHFHVFGTLGILAFYRDERVLLTAAAVTAADHLARGFYWPQSVYGVVAGAEWRWLEHAGWVVFAVVFLGHMCRWARADLRAICERDAQVEFEKAQLEIKVAERTRSLTEANARLEALATTDPLTGLPNHRALVFRLDHELERAARYYRQFSVVFVDVDHFKALNDTLGHAVGDRALTEIAALMRSQLRGVDTVGRWGGEEFVVIMPETDLEQAKDVAETLRRNIETHSFGGGVRLTCSMGVASYPDDGLLRADLVNAADRAMYAAKRLGRNQVRWISDPIVATMENAFEQSREEIMLKGTIDAFAALVEARDAYTGEHGDGVRRLSCAIADEMGLTMGDQQLVAIVAQLHDIGKIAVPDSVLTKPGSLCDDEWAVNKMHPILGAEVVNRIPILRHAAPGIRGHHERWDGTGYPDGLAGDDIPLAARIVAVADAYCAITSDRVYRSAQSHAEAMDEIRRCSGTQFDPKVVAALDKVMGQADRPMAA